MAEIIIEVKGLDRLQKHLNSVGKGVVNLHKPMSDVGKYLTNFFSGEVFASRGRVIGQPWKPLNPHYAAQKAKRWPGRPPLVQTGEMMRSFQSNPAISSVRIWNSSRHFDYHQLGTRRMPARVMMSIDQTRTRNIVAIIDQHIRKLLDEVI